MEIRKCDYWNANLKFIVVDECGEQCYENCYSVSFSMNDDGVIDEFLETFIENAERKLKDEYQECRCVFHERSFLTPNEKMERDEGLWQVAISLANDPEDEDEVQDIFSDLLKDNCNIYW